VRNALCLQCRVSGRAVGQLLLKLYKVLYMFRRIVNQNTARLTMPTLRTYMSEAAYNEHLAPRLRTLLEGSPRLPVQSTTDGLCEERASQASYRVLQQLTPFNNETHKIHTTSYDTVKGDVLESSVRAGKTAVITTADNTTEESRFNGVSTFHATTVIGESRDKKSYVLFDPDTSHDPRTQKAHDSGTSQPRHDLRLMAKEDVHNLHPFVEHIRSAEGDEDIAKVAMKIHSVGELSPFESLMHKITRGFKGW